MAELLFKALLRKNRRMIKYEVDSAGTAVQIPGLSPDSEMLAFMNSKSIKGRHKSRSLTKTDLETYDLIIPVIDDCLRDAQRLTQNQHLRDKVIPLSTFFEVDSQITSFDLPTPDQGDSTRLSINFSTILRAEKKLFKKTEELRKK